MPNGRATIHELEMELETILKSVSSFAGNGFTCFSLADVEAKLTGMSFPAAGVVFDVAAPAGNIANPQGSTGAAATIEVQFIIVVAVQYRYTGADDNRPAAYALLDEVRSKVMGYKGVNSRPWRFVGERPEADASGDGVVFYSQVWQTMITAVGNVQ